MSYLHHLKDFFVLVTLSICLTLCLGSTSREKILEHNVAVSLQRSQEHVSTELLQSRIATVDILSAISSTTMRLTQYTCIQSGADCDIDRDTSKRFENILKDNPNPNPSNGEHTK